MNSVKENPAKEEENYYQILEVKSTATLTEIRNAYEEGNNLVVKGGKPTKMAKIVSFDDHRIAMAFTILSIVAFGEYDIDNTDCIDISLPGFFNILQEIQR